MIPLTLAQDIRLTLLDYLTTTFNFQDEAVEAALLEFLENPREGLFKGPYVHLRLPFRVVPPDANIPLEIRPPFNPYIHQVRAFERLSARDEHAPQPTIITTGTGSGKTECFLYPILDYCYAHRDAPGIKAIILYPMNALASDQASRLAKMIWNDARLKGQITAGMYIGGEGEGLQRVMGPDHLVEDREILRKQPPDILLTNFKMLDFLLLRPEDKTLWAENAPDTLRFLVLDELHTYDGAQGSDVACLIRRLKARLQIPDGALCPIGTSATVVSEQGDTLQQLAAFAQQVFDVPFTPDSVIGEARITLNEFLPNPPTRDTLPADLNALDEVTGEKYSAYLERQARVWFDAALDPFQLADALKQHALLYALLAAAQDNILPLGELTERIARWDTAFAAQSKETQLDILQSFLALIAQARVLVPGTNEPRPFLTCQVQLWVREMSRLMREVSAAPKFFWRDDVPQDAPRKGLPAYFCRDCGHTGWLTVLHEGDDVLTTDHRAIYNAYFDHSKNIHYVYPAGSGETNARLLDERVCPQCVRLSHDAVCDVCECATIPVVLAHNVGEPRNNQPPRDLQQCPICGTNDALSIIGAQAASLSSVAISHLYTSPLNTDKKLLAFTDSVQDASHRAAFFGVRTYRFNLRAAFQATANGGAPIPLNEFTDHVLEHWRGEWQNLPSREQRLVATFMPPDLQDLAVYRQFMESSPQPMSPALQRDLQQRLSWEVFMEYGFTARLGRSLEKVGSSTAYLDPAQLEPVIEKLALIFPEELGVLKGISREAVHHFVVGLLERTRVRGGIAHPLLDKYAKEQGNWYMLTKKMQPLLSPFYKSSPRFPKFLTDSGERDVFDLVVTSGKSKTWYVDWAQRILSPTLGAADFNEVYRIVIRQLADAGILHHFQKGTANAYGIEPDALLVTSDTDFVRCGVCGHQQTVTRSTLDTWIGRACLNYQCPGHYAHNARPGQHYYRAVYEHGNVERIFPHEHTALLTRFTRERVEEAFKTQNRADATNLLSATPTLELGIDIGDLSATMACSVPPATANYLQRIGRAGRKTGNSIILVLANAQPHDLYFFEEPMEMMAGSIVPPGAFLDAPDMLKRQFLAFCMDTWTASDPNARSLPHNVQQMLANYKRGGFPENLLAFYEKHKSELSARFLELFGTEISQENRERLVEFAAGSELTDRVRQAIADAEAEREELRAVRRSFKERLDRINADPAQYENPQQEIQRLNREMNLLIDLIQLLEKKYVLNFFTDAGLLPNYAFPETGIRFRAVISGFRDGENNLDRSEIREYIRPAPVALREFAPFNTFYAEGRKLPVDHIELPGRDKAIEQWQFCPECSHMELVQASHYSAMCPVCGSTMWSDVGQKHDMIRFRQSSARVDRYETLVGDDSDDRDHKIYSTGYFFDIPLHASNRAFLIPNLPFGLEYLDKVTLREINFGLKETVGSAIEIADQEFAREGFTVCQECGLTVPAFQTEGENSHLKHTRNCLSSNRPPEWYNLYLYRELESEAVRILLPVSTTLVEEKLATFEACLDLGLRRWFRGDPEHLHILSHSEPISDGNRRRFLILYDTVPGGTSYLKTLAQPETFFEVLQLALDSLTSCRCRLQPDKKACYRCLYSYRTQRSLELISRRLGIEMLSEILAQRPQLESIPSLSDAHIDSLVESELEQRFVNALEQYAQEHKGCSWTTALRNGKKAWEFKIESQRWLVEPQVLLRQPDVSVPSKADFVFFPIGAGAQAARPVAVFTDGFSYHVRPNQLKSNLADDVLKRRALMASGKYLVWSVTWDDIDEFENNKPFAVNLFAQAQRNFDRVANESHSPLSSRILRENGLAQLLEYLQFPNRSQWQQMVHRLLITTMLPLRPPVAATIVQALKDALHDQISLPLLSIPPDAPAGNEMYAIFNPPSTTLLLHSPQELLRDVEGLAVTIRLDDQRDKRTQEYFRESWRRFLLLCNVGQFLPTFVPVTSEFIQEYGKVESIAPEENTVPVADETWTQVFKYAAPECHNLLHACHAAKTPPPTVGYELANSSGRIIASAELAWEDRHITVLLDTAPDRQAFKQAEWSVYSLAEQKVILQQLHS